MTKPQQQTEDATEAAFKAAAFLRGSIITSFAQVEFVMADLAVKGERFPEYRDVIRKFPYKLEDRIRAVRLLLGMPGPFAVYRKNIEPLLGSILRFEEVRHFLAHGLLTIRRSGEKHTLEYRMYRPEKAGQLKIGFMSISIEQLEGVAEELGSYAHATMLAFSKLYLDLNIK